MPILERELSPLVAVKVEPVHCITFYSMVVGSFISMAKCHSWIGVRQLVAEFSNPAFCECFNCDSPPVVFFQWKKFLVPNVYGADKAHAVIGAAKQVFVLFSTLSLFCCIKIENVRCVASTSVGLGVSTGMLGRPFLLRPDRLACMGLVSHVIILLRAILHGILPQSRLAQPGVICFISFCFDTLHLLCEATAAANA